MIAFKLKINELLGLNWQLNFTYRVEKDSVAKKLLLSMSDAPLFGDCADTLAGQLAISSTAVN